MDTGISYRISSQLLVTIDKDPFDFVDLRTLNLHLADTELSLPAFASHRTQELQCTRKLIEEISDFDSDVKRTKNSNEIVTNNLFDLLNPDVTGSKANIDGNNSCDGNEIDVVGDIDMEDSMVADSDLKAGRLLDDFVNNESSLFSMVGFEVVSSFTSVLDSCLLESYRSALTFAFLLTLTWNLSNVPSHFQVFLSSFCSQV